MAGIGEQRVDRPARRSGPKLVHALSRRQVRFNDGDVRSKTAESFGGRLNLWAVGRDQQIEPFLRTDRGQLQSDTRRAARHNCEWFAHTFPSLTLATQSLRRGSALSSSACTRADRLLLFVGMGRVSGGLIDAGLSQARELLVGGLFLV